MWQPNNRVLQPQPHKQPHMIIIASDIMTIMTMIHPLKYKAVALTSPCMGVGFFYLLVFLSTSLMFFALH